MFAAIRPLSRYWDAYGGWREFVSSLYLWVAFFFTVLTYPAWLKVDEDGISTWAELPTSILPNILGFSMGGMAIMLAFAGSNVFLHLTENGKQHSYFIKIVASFYHFILAQTFAIFMGLLCRVYTSMILSFIGYWALCYALLVSLATAAQLFNTARIANIAASIPTDTVKSDNSENR